MILNHLLMLSRLELTTKERKAILLASLGCVLEFYDFIIFGFMAINLIDDVFAGQLTYHRNIFVLFCVLFLGYLIRPLGMKIYSKIAPVQETYRVDALVTGLFIFTVTCFRRFVLLFNCILFIFAVCFGYLGSIAFE